MFKRKPGLDFLLISTWGDFIIGYFVTKNVGNFQDNIGLQSRTITIEFSSSFYR